MQALARGGLARIEHRARLRDAAGAEAETAAAAAEEAADWATGGSMQRGYTMGEQSEPAIADEAAAAMCEQVEEPWVEGYDGYAMDGPPDADEAATRIQAAQRGSAARRHLASQNQNQNLQQQQMELTFASPRPSATINNQFQQPPPGSVPHSPSPESPSPASPAGVGGDPFFDSFAFGAFPGRIGNENAEDAEDADDAERGEDAEEAEEEDAVAAEEEEEDEAAEEEAAERAAAGLLAAAAVNGLSVNALEESEEEAETAAAGLLAAAALNGLGGSMQSVARLQESAKQALLGDSSGSGAG